MLFRRLAYYFIRKYVQIKNPTVKIKSAAQVKPKSTFEGKNVIGFESRFEGDIGLCSYIGSNCNINGKIGRYCCIASNVCVVQGRHPVDTFVSVHPVFYSTQKQNGYTYVDRDCFEEFKYADEEEHGVLIGNDVWIGSNVIIMSGVRIGDGAVVAAGAIVTKNVEPYSIVGGVPAKTIRRRFEENQIDYLRKIEWWNRSEDWIKKNAASFTNIDYFMKNIK